MSETYEAVQTIGGRWEIRGHHDDCAEGIPLNEAGIRRAVACLYACAGLSTEALEAGAVGALIRAAEKRHRLDQSVVYRDESDGRVSIVRGTLDHRATVSATSAVGDALHALGVLP